MPLHEDTKNYEDGIFADALAAYKDASSRVVEAPPPVETPEPAPVDDKVEIAADKPDNKPDIKDDDDGRARGADGKFVAKSTEKTVETKEALGKPPVSVEAKQPDKLETAVVTPAGGPPPSWSIKSKAAWDRLPADVQADIVKREGEVSQGLVALRDYKDLKPYAEMAQQNNTTIKDYIDRALQIEGVLRKNLPQGLAILAQNSGLNQERAAHLFAQMAHHYSGGKITMGGGAASQNGGQPAAQADPLVEAMRPLLGPILKEFEEIKGWKASQEQANRTASTQQLAKAIEEFGADPANRYFPDLEGHITQLFETGMVKWTGNPKADLKAAYDLAARMNPQIHEALIERRLAEKLDVERKKEQEAADKAKAASRSITGSRVPGTTVVDAQERHANHDDDIRADVTRAMRASARA